MLFSVQAFVPSGVCVFSLKVEIMLFSVYQREAWSARTWLFCLSRNLESSHWIHDWTHRRCYRVSDGCIRGPAPFWVLATLLPCQLCSVWQLFVFNFKFFFFFKVKCCFTWICVFENILSFYKYKKKKELFFGWPVHVLIILWSFLILVAMFICLHCLSQWHLHSDEHQAAHLCWVETGPLERQPGTARC